MEPAAVQTVDPYGDVWLDRWRDVSAQQAGLLTVTVVGAVPSEGPDGG